MTGLLVSNVANNLDGSTMNVVLSGVASGAVSFLISRQPDISLAIAATATEGAAPPSGTGTYQYTVNAPNPALWYVWAVDDDMELAS